MNNVKKTINDLIPDSNDYDKQKELFKIMHSDDCSINEKKSIREKLINMNIGLVKAIAYEYSLIYRINIRELESYGYEGLILAVDKFDENLNYKFATFAGRYITGYISKGVHNDLGFSSHARQFKLFFEMKKEVENETGEKLENNFNLIYEIADRIACKCNLVGSYRDFLLNDLIINVLGGVIDNADIKYCYDDPANIVCKKEFCSLVNDLLVILNKKELEVIKMRYGIDNNGMLSLAEIGKILGLSRERIRQIEEKSLNDIKKAKSSFYKTRKKILKEYLKND